MKTLATFVATAAFAFCLAPTVSAQSAATPQQSEAQAQPSNAPHGLNDPITACGPADVKFKVEAAPVGTRVPGPDPNAARIYIIQDYGELTEDAACFHLGCITTKIAVDGSWVGAAQGGSWFSFTVPAGEHHMCANWQSKLKSRAGDNAFARFSVLPGYVYYYRVRILYSHNEPVALDLDLLNMDEGRYLILNKTQSVSHEEK